MNTAGLTTHTGHRTLKQATLPPRTKREIYLSGYQNAGSLAPTTLSLYMGKLKSDRTLTPHPKKKESYLNPVANAGSLAPTASFTGGKNFLAYAGFFKDFLLFMRYGSDYVASIIPKTPQNRAKSASRRVKTA